MTSASIVLYNTPYSTICNLIIELQKSNISLIYIIDNSSSDSNAVYNNMNKIKYLHNTNNIGFGSAHNIAFQDSISNSYSYHFIINPDINVTESSINNLISIIDQDKSIGAIMPKILNFDGSIQYLPKLLPNPISVIYRLVKWPNIFYNKFITKYELRDYNLNNPINVPILSGCFTLYNLNVLNKHGLFDESFFMYFEDWDLSRRIHKHFKTIYYPTITVNHGYENGARKNLRLFKIFSKSYFIYFNKWGWIIDSERKAINKKVLDIISL
jgi:GT2 family glycosyltransferase